MNIEFTPSKPRHFALMAVALSIGALIAFLFFAWQTGEFRWGILLGQVVGFSIGVGLAIRFGLINYSVTITDEAITGPSKRGWNRVVIPIPSIDWTQTRCPFWWNIEGSWYVQSKSGEVILLSGMVFAPDKIRAILKVLKEAPNTAQ